MNQRERERNYAKYGKLLADRRWQRKRREMIELAEHLCEVCGTDGALHVHHGFYEFGRKPWEYPDSALHVLCADCHERADEMRKEMRDVFGSLSGPEAERALAYVRELIPSEWSQSIGSFEQAQGVANAYGIDAETLLEITEQGKYAMSQATMFSVARAMNEGRKERCAKVRAKLTICGAPTSNSETT